MQVDVGNVGANEGVRVGEIGILEGTTVGDAVGKMETVGEMDGE